MVSWSALPRRTQLRIAVDVARRRGGALARKYPNVVSVGAGYRSRQEEAHPVDEVCLRFLVSRKWKSKRARHEAIPGRIRAVARISGRTFRLSIPTDVSEFSGGAPHSVMDLTDGITSRSGARLIDRGSACCLVRNADIPAERYVMSCYHVFSPDLGGLPGDADCLDFASGDTIGPMLQVADPDDGDHAVDAALALVDDAAVDAISYWGAVPFTHATQRDLNALRLQSPLSVCGLRHSPATSQQSPQTRSGPIRATFQSIFPQPIPFDYRATTGRILRFAETIQYVADVRAGDSGAALVDDAGKIYGMHFYGQGNIGYAFAATTLFDSGVFQLDIVL